MTKILIIVFSILITFSISNAQTPPTAQDLLKSSSDHYKTGALETALGEVNKAIEMDPKLVDAYFLRSIIEINQGHREGALADYNKIIELAPNLSGVETIYSNRSVLRLFQGDIDGALADLDKAVALNPRMAENYNARAIARLQKGDAVGSLADYEKALELNPNIVVSLIGRGNAYYLKGDLDKALADFNRAMTLDPNYAAAYVNRGIVFGLKGALNNSLADIRKGFTIDPKTVAETGTAKFETSFMDLNHYISKNPENAGAYAVHAIFRLLQGKQAEADKDLRKCLRLNPKLKPNTDRITSELKKANKS